MSNTECFVVKKGRQFLQGTERLGDKKRPIWTAYKHNAWQTKNPFTAYRIAKILGGTVYGFNPLTGDVLCD